MVTVQDIGLQLTKPVKELSNWDYPFSQTLETYCSLFNTIDNKNFGEAGLVLQNSTAVFVQRLDYLWNKTEYFRNIFVNEPEEINTTKKRDRNFNINCQDFKTINFAEDLEKNIDIKKNHITHETVKSKSRRFTQLEKNVAQNIPIDIYDVNGEVIGKKYDFRCNQNLSMDGILVDEFAPQDFCCGGDSSDQEKSRSTSSPSSHNTESLERSFNMLVTSTIQDGSDENMSTDVEFEKNDDDSPEEVFDSVTSFEMSQNCLSNNTAVTITSMNNSNDQTITANEIDTSNRDMNTCNDTVLSDKNDSIKHLNNNINKSVYDGEDPLCSPAKSNSQGGRTPSINTMASLSKAPKKSKSLSNCAQNTPTTGSSKHKIRMRSKSTLSLNKRIVLKRKKHIVKNLLTEFQKDSHACILVGSAFPRTDRSSMFKEDMNACLKYIQQYNPVQYDTVTNETSDLLGFRLYSNADVDANDNATVSSNDDGIFEQHSSSSASPLNERFCDMWFQSDSHSLSNNVNKWHEIMQPKLREAEQKSVFNIRDYTLRIIESLKASNQRKINFSDCVQKEDTCEVARYFLASLDLASQQNVEIKRDKNLEHNIELFLLETDK